MTVVPELDWIPVCRYDVLLPERGVAALVDGKQVAVFRTHDDRVYATANADPFSGANVLSRGIVGSRGDIPVVISPMYKQSIDLRTGRCLDDDAVSVVTWPVRVAAGHVEVGR